MKLTFGKFSGWDTDDLAKAGTDGRSYLGWAADNLKSPIWRDECARALRDNAGTNDDNLEALAIVQGDKTGEIDIYEAKEIVACRREDEAHWDNVFGQIEAAQTAVVHKYVGIIGIDETALRKAIVAVEKYADVYDEMPPVERFSSPQRRDQMAAMYQEWKACYDAVDF